MYVTAQNEQGLQETVSSTALQHPRLLFHSKEANTQVDFQATTDQ